MSAEHASLLLDAAGVDGQGAADRLVALFGEHGNVHELDPDDKAAAYLADLLAKDWFSGVTAERAALLLDVLADVWHLPVRAAGLPAVLAEDLDGGLAPILEDLELRVAHLPSNARSEVRRRIANKTKGRRGRVRDLPVDCLGDFARHLRTVEERVEGEAA